MEILQQLGEVLIVSLAISGGVAWVLKTTINHFLSLHVQKYKNDLSLEFEKYKNDLSIDLEKHKNELSNESTRSTEQFRSQLQLAAREHDVRFTKLHEKRVATLAQLYSLLSDAYRQMFESEDDGSTSIEANISKVSQACHKASEYFAKHRLHLSSDLAKKVETFILKVEVVSSGESVDPYCSESIDEWSEMRSEVIRLSRQVEAEFRMLLGSDPLVTSQSDDAANSEMLVRPSK